MIRQNVQRKANHFMIIRRTQNKFGIKKDGAWQKKQFSIWEFFLLLLSKAQYIVLAALLGAGLSLCYFKMMVPPRYTATAKLYITGQETLNLKLLSIRTGTLLTVDYQEVFKTWEVQENAADFRGSESQLLRPEQVEVSNPVGTRVLYISYTSEDPNAAAEAANAYAQAGREFMFAAMDIPQPVLFSAAVPPSESSGMGQKGFAAMGFILGTALAVCVIFLKFTFDDRPRKPQDIEVSAGIPTLAIVPKSKVSSGAKMI